MGLLELFKTEGKKYLQDSFGGILNPEWTPERAKTAGSLLLDVTPVVGDIKSGYEGIQAAKQGDYLGAGLGALGALPLVPNMAGMFIGKGAKTWDAVKASQAMDMEKAGVDPRKIWSETGNWKGPDGHWRQEIPDNTAVFIKSKLPDAKGRLQIADEYLHSQGVKPSLDVGSSDSLVSPMLKQEALAYADMKVAKGAPVVPLSDALFHPQLFDAYPVVGDIGIAKDISGKVGLRGTFDPNAGKITISGADLTTTNKDMSSTVMHELQHAIQEHGGWARGGNVDEFARQAYEAEQMIKSQNKLMSELVNQRDEALRLGQTEKAEKLREQYMRVMEQRMANVPKAQQDPYEAYRRLAGEAEARATQARMNMDMEERLRTFPADSYDVPLDQLIIRGLLNP